jgi:hypothetical protein
MQYLPEYGRKRPKRVGELLNGCIIVISCSPVAGMYTVTYLTALNMDNSKYEFCSIKNCQCRTIGVLEVPRRAVGLRSTVWGTPLFSHAPHNDVSVNDGPHIRRWSHKIIIL